MRAHAKRNSKSVGPVPSFKGFQATSPAASHVGAGNRGTNTAPERLLRSAIWREGLRFRLDGADLPGKPDITLLRARIVIFCDGDFWHGKDWKSRRERLARGSNARYWVAKIRRNMERDRAVDRQLRKLGWTVIRLWESEVRNDSAQIAQRIARLIAT